MQPRNRNRGLGFPISHIGKVNHMNTQVDKRTSAGLRFCCKPSALVREFRCGAASRSVPNKFRPFCRRLCTSFRYCGHASCSGCCCITIRVLPLFSAAAFIFSASATLNCVRLFAEHVDAAVQSLNGDYRVQVVRSVQMSTASRPGSSKIFL